MTLQELIEKRGKVADKMQDMTKHIENGDWSAENDVAFNDLNEEYQDLDRKIVALEAAGKVAQAMNHFDGVQRPGVDQNVNVGPRGTKEYEQAFKDLVQSHGRKVSNDLEIATDAKGGYVVSESWESMLDLYLENVVVMRRLATVRSYGHRHNVPLSTNNGTAAYMAEGASFTTNDVTLDNKVLQAKKIGNIVKATEELVADSFINLTQDIAEAYGMTFGVAEENAFTNGTGVAPNPTGFLTTADNGLNAASATAITMDELIDLKSSVREVYANRGTWMMNRTSASLVRKLKDSNGQYLWTPSTAAGDAETLLGHPLAVNEAMPAATTGLKAFAFGDFSQYRIGDREALQMQILREKYADTGEIGFRFWKRNDGLLLRAEAIKTITMA
jgi:HK97 family phage major capsid protein